MRESLRPLILCAVLLVVPLPLSAELPQTTRNFVEVSLPEGVSIEIPRNWVVLSENERVLLDSSVESRLDLSGVDTEQSALPFAANAYDDSGRTLGIVNVRYYPEQEITQAEVAALQAVDMGVIDDAFETEMRRGFEATPVVLVSWEGTNKIELNGIHALVPEYRRKSDPQGATFRVRLVRVLAGDRSFTLTVSYRENATAIMQPITDRIISSLRVEGFDGDPSTASLGQADSNLGLILLVSLVLTWGIGLAPPLVIRYGILRRPVGKWPAIGIVGVFWVVNLFIFTALGSQSRTHSALILVAIASYYILKKNGQKKPSESEPSEEGDTL